jgi:hypothetical protein
MFAASPFVSATAASEDITYFRIGTGGIAGTYYPIGGLIAQWISNPPGSRSCDKGGSCGVAGLVSVAQAANGSVANVIAIGKGDLESGFAQSDVIYWAYTGTGGFAGESKIDTLRIIGSLYAESFHLVVRKGSGIKSVADLRGKRISFDEPGSGTLVDARIVLNAYGLSEEDLKPEYVKPDVAVEKIKNNLLDGFFIVAGFPTKSVIDLASTIGAELVPITGPTAAAIIENHGFFSAGVIPAGAYKGIGETRTLSILAQWVVDGELDAELVYQVTKAIWNPKAQILFDKGHPKAMKITLDTALEGIAIPLHPGAARYYREIGLLK